MEAAYHRAPVIDRPQELGRRLKERVARFRETQQTAVAVKKRHAEFVFVLLDSEGPRAVRHMSLLGRMGDIPLVGDRHDVAEMTQLHFVPSEYQWRLN